MRKVLESLHTCPIPEVAKFGRTLCQWRTEILAYSDTGGMSSGGTEAIDGVIEKTRRLAHGFRNFTNYRIRILLAATWFAITSPNDPLLSVNPSAIRTDTYGGGPELGTVAPSSA
ncbi:transposase [Streptomyces sp. NPDC002668]|uniref:transposase n=1 Tax=Streptomyces sp. NPDC002668 TaxID=3154422 RepID=UPI00331E6803